MLAMIYNRLLTLALSFLLVSSLFGQGQQADAENCNLCHGLAMLGISGPENSMRSFEVSASAYSHSTHRNVICRDCHTDILQFPHPEQVEKVDCSKACHVTKPFALVSYSHMEQYETHALSSHGTNEKYSDEQNAAKPDCKYCHDNSFRNVIEDEKLAESAEHCVRCHEGEGLAGVLLHVNSHSGHRSASASIDVVELCSSCHSDQSRMEQFDVNLTQVAGFERHFHGKALKKGLDEVANCMDCHRNHLNLPADDPNSSTHANNIQQTCSSQSYCHQDASESFSISAIHSQPTPKNNPVIFFTEWGFILLTAGTMALLFAHIMLDFGRWIGDVIAARRKK